MTPPPAPNKLKPRGPDVAAIDRTNKRNAKRRAAAMLPASVSVAPDGSVVLRVKRHEVDRSPSPTPER